MDIVNTTLAHAWMVRTFLKHAEEIQDDEEMLEVPRMIFDYIRALEPAYERKEASEYLHRAKGKLPKLRKVAERLAQEHKRVSDHTNYQMAAASLSACVRRIEEALAAVTASPGPSSHPGSDADPSVLGAAEPQSRTLATDQHGKDTE
jgi:hypothetical protein